MHPIRSCVNPASPRLNTFCSLLGALTLFATPASAQVAPLVAEVDEAAYTEQDVQVQAGEVVIRKGLIDVSGADLPTDRPELSANGNRLVYTVEEGLDPFFILSVYSADRAGPRAWQSPWLLREGRDGYDDGAFVSWFFPAFSGRSENLVVGVGTLTRLPDGTVDFSTLASRFVTFSPTQTTETTLVTSAELAFPFGEIPQGARVSPDGRWLAFFASSTTAVHGIYLYDLTRRALHRLSASSDRDPVWTQDGRTLYFHELGAASRLGRLQLTFSGNTPVATRSLLEPAAAVAQEHPAPVAGSDVLLEHVQPASGEPYLAARRTCPSFKPVRLRMPTPTGEVLSSKRAATALSGKGATFMGKLAGDAHYRIYTMQPRALERVRNLVSQLPCSAASTTY